MNVRTHRRTQKRPAAAPGAGGLPAPMPAARRPTAARELPPDDRNLPWAKIVDRTLPGRKVDWFGALIAAEIFERTGDLAPLAEFLANAPEPPPAVRRVLGEALAARARLHGKAGRRLGPVALSPALEHAISVAYRKALAAPPKLYSKTDRRKPSDRAADHVCTVEPFCRLELKRGAIRRAVTAQNKRDAEAATADVTHALLHEAANRAVARMFDADGKARPKKAVRK